MVESSLSHRLEIIGLSCARGDRPLFAGVSLAVSAGELLHVVGSNGAGKTTLLRTLCGLSQPMLGGIQWNGTPIGQLGDDYREQLAYLGHLDGVQGELTPLENLRALACVQASTASPESSAAAALERMGLSAYRSFPAKILSQGQRRRLAIARLLVLQKPLWILDEPFTALDVRSCQLTTDLLSEHLDRGGIAVLSSHQDFKMATHRVVRLDLDERRVPQRRSAATPIAQSA